MTVKTMKISNITKADYNPRVELKDGDRDYESLKENLRRYSLVEPLVWNKRTKTLVGGHQRLNALIALGVEEAEVSIVDLTEEQEKLLNISLNRIKGQWDYDKLDELLAEIAKEDVLPTGFSLEEVDAMLTEEDLDLTEEDPLPAPAKEKTDGVYVVYLSFNDLEKAEEWLADHGLEGDFKNRSITFKMEGSEYAD